MMGRSRRMLSCRSAHRPVQAGFRAKCQKRCQQEKGEKPVKTGKGGEGQQQKGGDNEDQRNQPQGQESVGVLSAVFPSQREPALHTGQVPGRAEPASEQSYGINDRTGDSRLTWRTCRRSLTVSVTGGTTPAVPRAGAEALVVAVATFRVDSVALRGDRCTQIAAGGGQEDGRRGPRR